MAPNSISMFGGLQLAALASVLSLTQASTPHLYDVDNESGHITYYGDISIKWETFTNNGAPCTINMGPQNNSWFYTGVHTFNDPNYYFFEFYHFATVACDTDGKNCSLFDDSAPRDFFEFYHIPDPIYDLNFYSSMRDSDYPKGPEVQRTVDFTKANIQKATLDDEKGYRVQLGGSSWLQNYTDIPSMGLDRRRDVPDVEYDEIDDTCYLGGPGASTNLYFFEWTGYHDDFAIDYTFTNKKAKASLYYSFNGTRMTMTFEGSQKTFDKSRTYDENPDARLANLDSPQPQFEWVTGGMVESEAEQPEGDGKIESKSAIATPTNLLTDTPSPTSSGRLDATPTGEADEPSPTDSDSPGTQTSESTSTSSTVPGSGSFTNLAFDGWLELTGLAIMFFGLL